MKINDLRIICQKEKLARNKGLTLLNRKVSIHVTRLLIACNISANNASIAGIILGLAGSCMFIPGRFSFNIAGIFLLYLSLLCDQVDGELARYYKTVSLNGVYIDEIRHLLIYSSTVFCLSFPASQVFGSDKAFLLGFLGAMTLTVSRVEERLPYQIYTEKIILKDNHFGGTTACALKGDSPRGGEEKETNGLSWRTRIMRGIGSCYYGLFHYVYHQVWILIWCLLVFLFDEYILRGQEYWGWLTGSTALFLILTCFCPIVLVNVICDHFNEKRVDTVCAEIDDRAKKTK